ncbi:MAG TPA: chromate transporter [Alphaproteobacteria bacterium]|nr:chromate transporter [Alphaproteobacteria bacterium]
MDEGVLLQLVAVFAPLSLVAFGGGPTIVAELERQTVAVHGWLTHQDFIDIFAISRVAPGPGILMITLFGWKVAGWLGAVVASLAFYIPSGLLVFGASLLWRRHRAASWRDKVERGLAPIAIGLIFAGAYSVLNATQGGVLAFATAGLAAAVLMWRRVNPLLLLTCGAAAYALAYKLT